MKFEIVLAFGVLVVLTGSSQTTGQSVSLPPAFTLPASLSPAGTSQPPDLTRGPANESEPVQTSADTDGPPVEATTIRGTVGTVGLFPVTTAVPKTETMTQSPAVTTSQTLNAPVVSTIGATLPSAAPESLSSTPAAHATAAPPPHLSTTDGGPSPTGDPLTTFSSRTPLAGSTHLQPQSSATTTGNPLTSAAGRGAPGPPHKEAPSELNVGDEELKGSHSRTTSPLDPLLAALLSFFIVTTAIVFVVLFLKFRQRTNHPEFHRLQDLPMDDLMEDTPLSRYSY